MKLIDISLNCYAHLMENTIYLYVENEFVDILHVDNIEHLEDPTPLIIKEIELSSRPSLYRCVELL